MNPKFGRRSWVKLWVNEWLDGTTRFEMSDAQRAFWVDLLTMAGRSRFPGVICAGQIEGRFVGYPIAKFQALMSEPIDVESTFEMFARNGKIEYQVTSETPTKLYKISLVNWDRYQSEYQRQKKYRSQPKLQQSADGGYKQSNKTETEVEGEVDTEEKQNKTLVQPKALDVPFESFWSLYPRKEAKAKALLKWKHLNFEHRTAAIAGIARWKESGRWADPQFIPHAVTYLNGRRWEDELTQATPQRTAFEKEYHREVQVGSGPELPAGARMIRKGKR